MEHKVLNLEVGGSSPTTHTDFFYLLNNLFFKITHYVYYLECRIIKSIHEFCSLTSLILYKKHVKPSHVNGQQQTAAVMSHMSQSFKRRFSQRSPIGSTTASAPSPLVKAASTAPSPLSRNSLFGCVDSGSTCGDEKSSSAKEDFCKSGVSENTPAKFASTPARLMAPTPGLKTPKRPISATGYDTPPLRTAKRSARAKLFTTPTKNNSTGVSENTPAKFAS